METRFDGIPTTGDKRCHCVKSRCLKLYCDCFARGVYCSGCSCSDCHNTEARAQLVASKRAGIKEKNPEAFQGTSKGCNCRRSQCLKMYCECFKHGVACAIVCKCSDCLNTVDGLRHRSKKSTPPAYERPAPVLERLESAMKIPPPQDPPAPLRPMVDAPPVGASLPDGTHISTTAVSLSSPAGLLASRTGLASADVVSMNATRQPWTAGQQGKPSSDVPRDADASVGGLAQRWGVSKARSHVRASNRNAAVPTGLLNFPDEPALGSGAPKYRRVSNGDDSMRYSAVQGDQTFMFGAVGQQSLREVPSSDVWAGGRARSQSPPLRHSSGPHAWPVEKAALLQTQQRTAEAESNCHNGGCDGAGAQAAHQGAPDDWTEDGDCLENHQGPASSRISSSQQPGVQPLGSRSAVLAGIFASPEQVPVVTLKRGDPGPTTPAAHHLIFAPTENNQVGGSLGDGRILSASELLPLPTTGSQGDDQPACAQPAVSLFKTPQKRGCPDRALSVPFLEESPSERSTIPQLFTPENAVLDLDVSIKLRGLSDPGMSPLPAVTPLVVGTETAATQFRASQQPKLSKLHDAARGRFRSHRTLDFSNAPPRKSGLAHPLTNRPPLWQHFPGAPAVQPPAAALAPARSAGDGALLQLKPADVRREAWQYIRTQTAD